MRPDLIQLAAEVTDSRRHLLLQPRDRGLEPLDVAAHGVGEPVPARLQLGNHIEVQALAIDLDDDEPRLDRVAGGEVLARADDEPTRRAVGLLAQVGAQAAARGTVADPANDWNVTTDGGGPGSPTL